MTPVLLNLVLGWTVAFLSCSIADSSAADNSSTARVDSLECPMDSGKPCWPKCCFADQVFYVDKHNCGPANKSALLHNPEIFSIR
jgi:hypothetical protein